MGNVVPISDIEADFEAAVHGTHVTPIEQLLAEEEQGAAQTAAKKAKKQRQKAKKQQQRQAQQHLLEQQQQQHVQQQQDRQLDQQYPATQLTTPQEQQTHQQNEQAQLSGRAMPDDGGAVEAALARLAVSTPHLAASSPSSAAKLQGAATGQSEAACQPEVTDQSRGAKSAVSLASTQQPNLEGSDAFLQDLFCCPLTKVSSLLLLYVLPARTNHMRSTDAEFISSQGMKHQP